MISIQAADDRPQLPQRPTPHERDGRQGGDTPGRPHSLNSRRYNTASRPGDDQLRIVLNGLAVEHQARVRRVVAGALRFEDQHLVDDIAQNVWLAAWQYLLRGNDVPSRPAAFLSAMARFRVIDHYRLARVRREVVTDPLERLVELIGAAA